MLTLHNISKSFGKHKVLNNISFSINEGDKIAFLGANGAGKSTLIKIILGEMKMDSGKIESALDFKTQVGAMPQEDILISDLKTSELIELKSKMNNLKNLSVDASLKKVSLEQQQNKFVHSLSGGQKRRLSLLLSFLNNPSLLILDEPTTGMDLASVDKFWDIMNGSKFSTLIVTHDFNQIDKFFNRVIILKEGTVLEDITVKDIHNQGSNIETYYREKIKE